MNRLSFVSVGVCASLMGGGLSGGVASAAKTDSAAKGPKPSKMTCEEFLSVEDVVRPKLVYFAEGINGAGPMEDGVFDVDTTERLVPVLVEVCRNEPNASFMSKVKQETRKLRDQAKGSH